MGSKKHGKNKDKCNLYKAKGQREKNRDKKMLKIIKHLSKKNKGKYRIVENPKTGVLQIKRYSDETEL